MNLRYTPISSELFIYNRQRFVAEMLPESALIVHSNDVIPSNADGTLGFKQNTDLYYLSGIDQEETILWLCPEHPDEELREVLFIKETNESIRIWEGEKFSKKEATELSGIQTVFWTSQFFSFLNRNISYLNHTYLTDNEHDGRVVYFETQQRRFINLFKEQFPLHSLQRASPILSKLRQIKHPLEIEAIKQAIDITHKGFLSLCRTIKEEIFEFELEAELTHTFLKNRSRNHAFQPIIASGKNACVLHYISNNERCKSGDVVLADFGAEYANYNADITRCLPANGRFSKRQKEVYNAVLCMFYEARKRMIVGNTFQALRDEMAELMQEKLYEIGLLKNSDLKSKTSYKKYFPHGVSHHLGLDVHDVGSKFTMFQEGMVLTCEPGIYIPAEGIGIRLENDILISTNGPIDLMGKTPIEADEIEFLIQNRL